MRRHAVLLFMVGALLATIAPAAQAQVFNSRPVVHSVEAVNVTTTRATFRASVTWNEYAANWWFSYCRDFECPAGEQTPEQNQVPQGDPLQPETIEWPVTGLTPGTTYQLTVSAGNDTYKNDPTLKTVTFRTADPVLPPVAVGPSITAQPVTGLTPYAATLNAEVVPGTTGGPSQRTSVFFEWGEGGAFNHTTPPEQLPADASEYSISAPANDLTSGHTYQYRAVAVRGGQRFLSSTGQFSTPAVPACPSGNTYRTVEITRVVAIGCFRSAGERWVAATAVRLNGVLLEPEGSGRTDNDHHFSCGGSAACGALQTYLDSGNKLYLDKDGAAFGTTGRWKMSVSGLEGMHKGTLNETRVEWGGDAPLLSAGVDRSVELIDFPLAGQLTFTPKADGTSRLGLLVGMPVALGGVTGETAVKINPGGDLQFDRLRIEVGRVPIKGFELGNLKFLYDRSEERWEGSGAVVLPTPTSITVGAGVVVIRGRFGSFSGFVDNLNQHIAYGVYLQKVGVRFGLSPIRLGGDIGLSAGPKVAGIGIFGLDGSFDLNAEGGRETRTLPGGFTTVVAYPGYLQLSGSVSVASIPIRSAWGRLMFTNEAWIEAGGTVGIDIKAGDVTAFGLGGEVAGSLRGSAFEVSGHLGLTVFDFDVASADAILNNRGVAACGKVWDGVLAVGGYMRWGQGGQTVWACDMGKLRAALAARATQVGAPATLALPANAKQAQVQFAGTTGAPQIRLHGPGGRTIDTPAPGVGNTSLRNSFVAFRDDAHKTTTVLLVGTGDGKWSYELLPGSSALASVQSARPLPKVNVQATARRHGSNVQLRWRIRKITGQRVTFMEEGVGAPPRVLKTTTASRGSVRFKTAALPQQGRRIIAIVEQDGLPRARELVARYKAPKLRKITAVRRLRAARHGNRVTVTWARMAGAARFRAIVTDRLGRRTLQTVTRPKLTLGRAARKVSVRAVGIDGRIGKARTLKVKTVRG